MARELISEPIEADAASFTREGAAPGEPAWPRRFRWRGRDYEIERLERSWKTTDAHVYKSGDAYLRRHYADVVTACGVRLRIYAERGGRTGRWFLHSRTR